MSSIIPIGAGYFSWNGSVGTYVVSDDWCTCPDYLIRRLHSGEICKHSKQVSGMPTNLNDVDKILKYFDSSIVGLNTIYNGHFYSTDTVNSIYALPNTGKSLMASQDAFYLSGKNDMNVLYIDTEGGAKLMLSQWKKPLSDRFGNAGQIYIESAKVKDFASFYKYFGLFSELSWKEKKVKVKDREPEKDKEKSKDKDTDIPADVGGKTEFRFKMFEPYDLREDIKSLGIKFLILDSITTPIKTNISDEQQNNTAKASAHAVIYARLRSLQEEFGIGVLVTLHASRNVAIPNSAVNARGGVNVWHFSKRMVYMDTRQMAILKDYRRIWQMRGENKPIAGAVVAVKIDDGGMKDSPLDIEFKSKEKRKDSKGKDYIAEVVKVEPLLTGNEQMRLDFDV